MRENFCLKHVMRQAVKTQDQYFMQMYYHFLLYAPVSLLITSIAGLG